jgi:hypothetical protein
MKIDYTLLDPDRPKPRDKPDPRDLAEHRESHRTLKQRIAGHQRRIASHVHGLDEPLNDDDPLAVLEPFGVNADILSKLNWIVTIRDLRQVLDHDERGPNLARVYRARLRAALEAAEQWQSPITAIDTP